MVIKMLNQINVRINFLTVCGVLMILRIMQLYPTAIGWDWYGYLFLAIGVGFIVIGDYW